tara:strand:+ start:529 stop:843 length:315 start_codon:yes stop_codon:yes gene_type:complete
MEKIRKVSAFGKLEVLVDGKVVDVSRITMNGSPGLMISGSKLLTNKKYRVDPDKDPIEILKNFAREIALATYSPSIFGRLFRREKDPKIEANYTPNKVLYRNHT